MSYFLNNFFLSSNTYKFILSKYTKSKIVLQAELPVFLELLWFTQVSPHCQTLSFQIDVFNSICQQWLQSSISMNTKDFHKNMLNSQE